ncbi:MAG: FAD-binding protein, partial [Proteobacteria bacterium]|nr:FAD-binding protein [Pseudomonadota bacterium]
FIPEGVAFPATAEEISKLLKLANVEGFPIIARGAGSGFTGGSVPVRGGLVLSTERMNRIIDIDKENQVATVEPGVVCGDLQAEVEAEGLFYPPDPTSLNFSTIGGNIAECAGGPRAVKYGVTRDYLLGLQVVLPTGEIIETGVKTAKGVVGYDLTRLICGSEGTLGVVTRAHLRLVAKPEVTLTMLAAFAALPDASRAVSSIMSSGVVPSTLELIDKVCIGAVNEHSDITLPDVEALLFVEVDGAANQCEIDAGRIESILKEHGATDVKHAKGKKEIRALWQARRSISQSLRKVKPNKLNEDVVVPRSRIVELIEGVGDIAEARGLVIASFGHAGDGNIHVNVMIDNSDEREAAEGLRAVEDIFSLAISLEGTISGEHGVGTAKAPYLDMELNKDAIDIMKRIKDTFDPKGILNPGKIFTAG